MDPPEGRPPSKAQRIRDLAAKGMSIAEIQEQMKSENMRVSYQHVYNTLTYSRALQNAEEALKARKAMVHHREEGPRSLEDREILSEKKASLKNVRNQVALELLQKLRESIQNE